MLKDIASFIKYDKYYEKCPILNKLDGKNKFSKSIIHGTQTLLQIIYIGKIFNYNCYIPLSLDDLSQFLLFNRNFQFIDQDIFQDKNKNIFLLKQILIVSKKKLPIIEKNLLQHDITTFLKVLDILNNKLPLDFIKNTK